MKKSFYLLGILGLATIASCKKEHYGGIDENNVKKVAPNGFDYKTAKDVGLNLTLLTNNDQPLAGVVVSVYNTDSTTAGTAIFKGVTDAKGNLSATLSVASNLTQLVIDPAYVGLMRNVRVNIRSNAITATIGGKNGYSGDVVAETILSTGGGSPGGSGGLGILGLSNTDYLYPSPYTNTADAVLNTTDYPLYAGRPKYLEPTPDVVDATLLAYVNSSLPEYISVNNLHPEYLTSSAVSNINVTATSDVWITYVSEGAGYQNTLAYYTYNTNNPPTSASGGTSVNGIDKITMVFPNASGIGSGGALKSGDKVKLGSFSAGTTIAFVLIQNSWTGSGINLNAQKFYSDSQLNPESTSALKKHSIVLYDDVHKLYLFGFEDLNRESPANNPYNYASDNDFNDLVFYASANPVGGISTVGIPPIDKGTDSDGDGVPDVLDAFPNDPARAYITYFPSQNGQARLAFEDNWPAKGDYDLNDLVIDYRYTFVLNAQKNLVTLQGDYNIVAVGASFKNGFGVQLPFSAASVKSVTGQKAVSNYIQFASNGVEAGQTNAVIIPFDNHEAVIGNPDGAFFINTLNAKPKVQGTPVSVLVTFNTPMSIANLSASSINPFLICNLKRGNEAHLPGYAATSKANQSLFATSDDASLIGGRKTYTSINNYPWAISFNDNSFQYPLETISILDAYPHFVDWASSNGSNFADWYSNLTTGYRNTSNIYNK